MILSKAGACAFAGLVLVIVMSARVSHAAVMVPVGTNMDFEDPMDPWSFSFTPVTWGGDFARRVDTGRGATSYTYINAVHNPLSGGTHGPNGVTPASGNWMLQFIATNGSSGNTSGHPYFSGGEVNSDVYHRSDLSAYATEIDAGGVEITISMSFNNRSQFYADEPQFGLLNQEQVDNYYEMSLVFLDEFGATIGSLAAVSLLADYDESTWEQLVLGGTVPVGARAARLRMFAGENKSAQGICCFSSGPVDAAGNYQPYTNEWWQWYGEFAGNYADNGSVMLVLPSQEQPQPSAPPTVVPEPHVAGLMLLTLAGWSCIRRRHGA